MSQNEFIDLNKLSQKDLIIRLLDKVGEVEKDLDEMKVNMKSSDSNYVDLMVRVKVIETKIAMWAVAGATVATVLIRIGEKLL